MSRPLTVGTAGHIDHGKTALVRALTGRDTDRLAEEKRRGISIELGFAELNLEERRLSLVDVPGHKRFVRTMIAGATGINLFLMVVAADDGVMPQTREHLTVLQSLGVEQGVVALTKSDAVEEDALAIAASQAQELVSNAPIVPVSAKTGEGIEKLRKALFAVATEVDESLPTSLEDRGPVLHVDRVFTIAGHGTVVTGTLWSGRIDRGQRILLLPRGAEARVRAIEAHDRSLATAAAHQRVALNLVGVRREEVARGDVVTVPGSEVEITYRLDVRLVSGAERMAAERRVQVHLGTRETPSRLADLGGDAFQLRLERPLLARRGDRVVVRRIAPADTLGGGVVIRSSPPRHGPGWEPQVDPESPAAMTPATEETGVGTSSRPGPLARRLLVEIHADGSRPRAPTTLADAAGVSPREAERALAELVAAGEAVRVRRDVIYPATEYDRLREAILALAHTHGSTGIADVRNSLRLSRKYAQALLEHLDTERTLYRKGDRHYPRGTSQD